MKECHVEREIGGRMMRMETGVVAKLANACVMISHADSTVMCSAVRGSISSHFNATIESEPRLQESSQVDSGSEKGRQTKRKS